MRDQFLQKLTDNYGKWDKHGARFGNSSYGDIANDMCISGSQFSKLLNDSATSGMYERSIHNLDNLMHLKALQATNSQLQQSIDAVQNKLSESATKQSFSYKYLFLSIIALAVLSFIVISNTSKPKNAIPSTSSAHSLSPFFEGDFKRDYISPFLKISEAQTHCPGSAYEGTWKLNKPYVIPIPSKKPGLYYRAKSSDMKMKCYRSVESSKQGKALLGFEDMTHEIWIDTNREPLAPKYFNNESKTFTKAFYQIDFENMPSFKKVTTLKSFMFNFFELKGDVIVRNAEPSGRYAHEVDQKLVDQYGIDIKEILERAIGDMAQTSCSPAINLNCNPNTLVENQSTMSFDCNFTIKNENLGLGGSYPYTKAFKLVTQNYSDNLLCNCNDTNISSSK